MLKNIRSLHIFIASILITLLILVIPIADVAKGIIFIGCVFLLKLSFACSLFEDAEKTFNDYSNSRIINR